MQKPMSFTPLRIALPVALLAAVSGVAVCPAAAEIWTAGETASYTVRAPDGPAYRVKVKVPKGLSLEFERRSTTAPEDSVNMFNQRCYSGWPAAPSLSGDSFADALRGSFPGTFITSGRGSGLVRWAEYKDALFPEYRRLFALHPRLVRKADPEFLPSDYYGVEVSDQCMSRRTSRNLVRTVRIAPLKR